MRTLGSTRSAWLLRYATEGARGLAELSHVPHRCPHRIVDELAALLLAARRAHPSWGPVPSCIRAR
ncbi:MAG: hypothetical protein ACJ79A_02645, partial [Gemmatimonadaceae bacterium]